MSNGFIDETFIEVSSGKGGPGSISFRREKYVPNGGPDGGDGGCGGSIIFRVKSNLKTLSHISSKHLFKAKNGEPGKGQRMHGKNGVDCYIDVPPGTLIYDKDTEELLKDFSDNIDGEIYHMFKGGKGGLGNWHFRTARKQAPEYAQDGMPGQISNLKVELNVIADIGFVGFPSVGKSSLLNALTNANPKIAAYHFTTKIPNLGILRVYDKDVVLADLPGIIDGASDGIGLGFKFLKHISRTKALAFMIDMGDPEFLATYDKLLVELEKYEPTLLERKRFLIATKMDLEEAHENFKTLQEHHTELNVLPVSIFTREGLDELRTAFLELSH